MDKSLAKILIILLITIGVLVGALALVGLACYFSYKPMMANMSYQRGVKYKEYGWPNRSREAMEEAIDLAPGSDVSKKAEIFMDTRLPKAKNINDEAIRLNVKGYRLKNRQQDYKEAIKMFNAALEITPDFEWPYSNMAMIYYYDYHDFDKSKEYLEKALEINPHYTNARMNLAFILFTKARKELDDKHYELALSLFNEALDSCMVVKKADPDYKNVNSKIEDIHKYIDFTKERMTKHQKDKLE